jgi:glycosyltransferase involved in cell wall biosynthesis
MAIETASERDVRDEPRTPSTPAQRVAVQERIRVDGKHFKTGDARFAFRGVTYGTFSERRDAALFPETAKLREDLAAMAASGFSVVRTYTPPPPDMLEAAGELGLRILAGLNYQDWRYILGGRSADQKAVRKQAREAATAFTKSVARNPAVLGICIGNEVPSDVIRWVGIKPVRELLAELSAVIHDIDPDQLVTYANYPTAEYLHVEGSDFVTFNVFLEARSSFQRYLTKLQHAAGGRPLVMGEIGLNAGSDSAGEIRQADAIDWQLEVAMERGVAGCCIFSWTDDWVVAGTPVADWHFGLTRSDRSSRASLAVAERWNRRELRDLKDEWPSISVVVCAHNAEATLDECLEHTCALDYPQLEIVVVDDGSSDDTAAIAQRHPEARLVSIPHSGLAVARNEGLKNTTGEIVAFLDSDAFPSPEWPYHLALGLNKKDVVGVGGPNECPPGDGPRAQEIAAAPGGPIHVLLSDDRAEHIPGCNMAFTREALMELGGFDPIYMVAGDDVDFCWRVLDHDWEIGFNPAALVWHHPRSTIGGYLRQQWGYGASEALVQGRHPDRFSMVGVARWRGRIYSAAPLRAWRERIYRGLYGAAPYQSVYRSGGDFRDVAHQLGVPIALAGVLLAPTALLERPLALVSMVGAAFLLGLAASDFSRIRVPENARHSPLKFRLNLTLLHMLQPVARAWGRARNRSLARRNAIAVRALGPIQSLGRGIFLLPDKRPRQEVAENAVQLLRKAGMRVVPPSGWEPYDALVLASLLIGAQVVTSAHPPGWLQLRIRRYLRWKTAVVAAGAIAVAALMDPRLALLLAIVTLVNAGWGIWRTGPGLRGALMRVSG